ncbi:MAG: hypothetical protein IT293_14405 [Deltaproteobacteria bacterium]|nr:hypothetical protein [Deltaproteobacteria bacterium]
MLSRLVSQMLVLAAVADTASAGVVIVGTYTGTKTPKGRTVEFRIQDGRGRISSQPGQFIYYDHGKRTAYIVDMEKKTSFAVDEARAKQISAQLDEAQKMMEAKLKDLPPEQRAMVEKMMKEQGGGRPTGARKPLDFLKVSEDTIGAWPCARYRASGDGRKVEVCTAEADALNIPPDDVAVFEGFLDLSERMAGESGPGGGAAERGYEGLPLERKELRDGVVTDRFVIDSITTESMPAEDLRVPSGLKEVTPPGPPSAR